jgi:hypothetical protein
MSVNETVPLDEIQSVEASEPVHIARTHEKYMASMVSSMQNGIEKTNELILKLVKSIEGNSASCSQRLNPTKTGINKASFNTMEWWGICPTGPFPLPHH